MDPLSKTLTITEAKRRLLDLVEDIENLGETITLTKNGIPTTVMMSLKDYESLIETMEILADPGIMKSLRKSRSQVQNNQLLDEDGIWD